MLRKHNNITTNMYLHVLVYTVLISYPYLYLAHRIPGLFRKVMYPAPSNGSGLKPVMAILLPKFPDL